MISRRKFLNVALSFTAGALFSRSKVSWSGSFPQFFFAQLKYRGGDWDPNPEFVEAITEELELRTSIDGMQERRVVTLTDGDLFFCPFLFLAGKYEFDPWTPQEREILRRFLTHGGFLFAEDAVGAKAVSYTHLTLPTIYSV